MKRILSVISGNIESGGVETYLKNAYENIGRKGIEIDLFVPGKIIYEPYANAFRDMGCNLLVMNIPQKNRSRYIKLYLAIENLLNTNKYDLIHVNTGNLTIQTIILKLAKKHEIPERIAHSHGTLYKESLLKEIIKQRMRKVVNQNATAKIACSPSAAESLFGKDVVSEVKIALNGIDVDSYAYDINVRCDVRERNGWETKFVIGSVGRLAPEKNYSFVIDVFFELLKKRPESLLVLIGDGEEKRALQAKVEALGIGEKVQFLGARNDVPKLMQGMDVFILASKREALGIVNIEAQTAGLPCVISKEIPQDVKITDDVHFVPLSAPTTVWADMLIGVERIRHTDHCSEVKSKGYDISDAYKIIESLYH